jgi:GDP-L-fucose synthase
MTSVPFALDGLRVWVAGHAGMVGSAICRRLAQESCEVVTAAHSRVDLRRQAETEAWMASERPDAIFVAAAKSCIYPRLAPQPMREEALLTGPLEPTNEWYAIAKIAGIEMCRAYRRQYGCDFISAMPTNLYGPEDNFDLDSSHVVPALIAKAHRAKMTGASAITVWGSGRPRRELLYVDDLADALVHLMKTYSDEPHVNVGTGEDVTIDELARTICDVVGFRGGHRYDASKPDGAPRKLLDVGRLRALGWRAKTPLRDGLARTYDFYLKQVAASG